MTKAVATTTLLDDALTFARLAVQNRMRRERWHDGADDWTGSDWGNAMAGECGEACNLVKKLRRHETGAGIGYNTPSVDALISGLAEELADVVIYADLVAQHYGINLGGAVCYKFNAVSIAQGFPERL